MSIIASDTRGVRVVRSVSSARFGVSTVLTGTALLAALAGPVQAQTAPSRVVPQSVAPVQTAPDGAIMLPETRASAAPAGADKLSVRLGQVVIEGGDAALAADLAAVVGPLEGRQASVAEVYQAAAQIEALYAARGQVLTRATVPPQKLTDGSEVRIRIVEGFIEAIDARAVPPRVRAAVEARVARLVGRKGLTLAQIERHLLLASRVPGVSLESVVVPGQDVGGAVLLLKAQWKPVSGMLGVDNRLSDSYDNANFDAQLVANSVLGLGEQVYGVVSTASDFALFEGAPLRRVAGIGTIVPIGTDGLSLNAEYIHADTNPKVPKRAAPTAGKLDRVALRLRYPLVLNRRQALNLSASFDMLAESQSVRGFNLTLSRDRLRFATFGADWTQALQSGGTVGIEASFTQGLDVFDARNAGDVKRSGGVLMSRFGSEPVFSKLNGALTLRRPLAAGFEGTLTARGQVTLSGALPSSAQFSLDAGDGLSGFNLGSVNVDSGGTVRSELARAVPLESIGLPDVVATPYLFGAIGGGRLSQPTALEHRLLEGWSLGGGLRAALPGGFSAHAELSRSHANVFTRNATRLIGGVTFRF